jgi:hypothetical protein
MLPLRELQYRFRVALTADLAAPDAPAAIDAVLLGLVRDHGRLGAAARIQIYRDMYRARLVDILREDFPRVAGILGDDEFEAVAGRYVTRHPSVHPSVRYVGDRFADFVDAERLGPPFLRDLARLEWARLDVFDDADAEPLRMADLQGIAPADWPALELRAIPACRLLECAWPVHEIWAATRDAADDLAAPEPRPVTIRVWREGSDVSHAAIGVTERRVFPLLERGAPFSVLCAALEDDLASEEAAREIGGLLLRWLEDGVVARLPS